LGYEICQRILQILTDNEPFSYLDEAASAILAEERALLRSCLRPGIGGLSASKDEIRWWTFAGGRINATLRYALEELDQEWKIVPDNFAIRVYGADLTPAAFRASLAPLRDRDFWADTRLWNDIISTLPNYRLSKFQPLMPDWVEREVVARYLLDMAGAQQWLARFLTTG